MTMLAQLRREFASFFYSPIGYVLLAASTVINSIVFIAIVEYLSDPRAESGAAMQTMFGGTIFFWMVVIVLSPLITMRTLSEERHSGTIETLLTAPITDLQVVLAKYFASVGFYIVMWLPTLLYPLWLSRHSDLDMGPLMSGYLGTVGIGMTFLSIGIFCSSITRNQIIAALLSFGASMFLFMLSLRDFISPSGSPDSVWSYLNLWSHMDNFGRGIIDTRYLVYYGSITIFMLFCTLQVVQARRWKG